MMTSFVIFKGEKRREKLRKAAEFYTYVRYAEQICRFAKGKDWRLRNREYLAENSSQERSGLWVCRRLALMDPVCFNSERKGLPFYFAGSALRLGEEK